MVTILSAKDIIRLFFIYKKPALYAFAATLIIVIAGLYIIPPKYASEAKLLVKLGRENTALPVDIIDRPAVVSNNAQRDQLLDEATLLQSSAIIEEVARKLERNLSEQPSREGWWETLKGYVKDAGQWLLDQIHAALVGLRLADEITRTGALAAKLEKNFTVEHKVGSAVLELSFRWRDPNIAQRVLREWINIYLEQRQALLGGESAYPFYEQQAQAALAELTAKEQALQELHRNIGSLDLSERERMLAERLEKLRSSRDGLATDINGLKAGISSSAGILVQTPRYVIAEKVTADNPALSDFNTRLHDALVERENALRIYQVDAEPVRQLDNTIANLRALIAAEPTQTVVKETSALNRISSFVEENRANKLVRLDEISKIIHVTTLQLHTLEQQHAATLATESRIKSLQRDISVAEKNYSLYIDKLEKVRIDRALDTSRITNVAVMEAPTANLNRVFPKTLQILLASPLVAAFAGLVVAFISTLTDKRIHDGWKIGERFGVPLLAAIPAPRILPATNGNPSAEPEVLAALHQLSHHLLQKISSEKTTIAFTQLQGDEGSSTIISSLCKILSDQGHTCQSAMDIAPSAATGACKTLLIDAPPIHSAHQCFSIFSVANGIVLIAEAGKTTAPSLDAAIRIIQTAFPGKLLGIVLSRQKRLIPEAIYQWLR